MIERMTKIDLIKEQKTTAIKAIESYLDRVYSLQEKYFDKDGKLLPFLTPDSKLEAFLNTAKEDTTSFEVIRRKLIANDFDLTKVEINLIALAYKFSADSMHTTAENLLESEKIIRGLAAALMLKDET